MRKIGVIVADLISPPGSTRYLLDEPGLSDFDPCLGLVHMDNFTKGQTVKQDEACGSNSKPPFSSCRSPDQVLSLMVNFLPQLIIYKKEKIIYTIAIFKKCNFFVRLSVYNFCL